MREESWTIYLTFGFVIAAIVYIALLAITLGRGLSPSRIVFAGLVTLVAAIWFGNLAQLVGVFLRGGGELAVALKGDAASVGAGAMARVGVVLVLSGLGLALWSRRSGEKMGSPREEL